MLFDYDDESIESIKEYANGLIGITYNDILQQVREYINAYEEGKVHSRSQEFVDSLKKDKLVIYLYTNLSIP